MFNNRNPATQSEITSAPPPAQSSSAADMNTYPPDKKPGTDASQAEMGMGLSGANDTDSGFASAADPKHTQGRGTDGVVVDAVWGRIDENGPNYRNLGWYVACLYSEEGRRTRRQRGIEQKR